MSEDRERRRSPGERSTQNRLRLSKTNLRTRRRGTKTEPCVSQGWKNLAPTSKPGSLIQSSPLAIPHGGRLRLKSHHAHYPARDEENREFVLQKIGEGDIPKI